MTLQSQVYALICGRNGVVADHIYMVEGVHDTSDGNQLVKTFNPYGSDRGEWKGEFGDNGTAWTEALKAELDHVDENDSIFYMRYNNFMRYFSDLYVALKDKVHTASFLKINDQSAAENPGVNRFCGAKCTRHQLVLSSEVDQNVDITLRTFSDRHFSQRCEQWGRRLTHMLCVGGPRVVRPSSVAMTYGTLEYWKDGPDAGTRGYDVKAGENITTTIELDFTLDIIPKDWGVSAIAEYGPVKLVHREGIQSDSWHHISSNTNSSSSSEGRDTTTATTTSTTTTGSNFSSSIGQDDFNDWCEAYKPKFKTGCGFGFLNDTVRTTADGQPALKVAMSLTCKYDWLHAT